MSLTKWKPEYNDHAGFIRTQAFEEAARLYSEEDRFRILLNRDIDPDSFAQMQKFFNDLWSRRDALIAEFDSAANDKAREAIAVDYSEVTAEAEKA